MRDRKFLTLAVMASLGLAASSSEAATEKERRAMLASVQARYERLSARTRAHLPAYGTLFSREAQFEAMDMGGKTGDDDFGRGMEPRIGNRDSGSIIAGGRVSDNRDDILHGGLTGFMQDQSSTGWCSPNAVMAYRDTGSFYDNSGLSGLSFSRSSNNGVAWTDMGALYSDLYDREFLNEAQARCSDANTFYIATSAIDFGPFDSQIVLAKSTNAGINFKPATPAVSEDLFTHFLTSPWMAVDPSNNNRLYITYSDYDSTGNTCGTTSGSPIAESKVRVVRSDDRGETWSSPVTVDSICDSSGFTANPRVAVGPTGDVNVTWNAYGGSNDFDVVFARSTNNGASFGSAVAVAGGDFPGNFGTAQSNFFMSEAPAIAVDTTAGPRSGRIYVTWTEGTIDWPDLLGTYNFADVLFSFSSDGGATWSAPLRVNNNPESSVDIFSLPIGTDQFHPGIAVDRVGNVGVCFYDRRRDPANYLMDRTCAKSTNGGSTWVNAPKTLKASWVLHSQDMLHQNGEWGIYDDLASDFRKLVAGFRGGYVFTGDGQPSLKVNIQ